jgi:transposase
MKVLHEICCGIDVHSETLTACLNNKGKKETRTFSTMTYDLLKMRDWLVESGCKEIVIESTGVYWKPVYNILDGAVKVIVVNPEHVKGLRGHKTDVKDAEWLSDLLRHGLVRPSFIPPEQIREMRELTRYRDSLVGEHRSVANRIVKLIESANIKLAEVATDVLGASGRAMLRALTEGESDNRKLAEMAQGKLKKKEPQLVRALEGRLLPMQRFVLSQLLDQLEKLEEIERRVNAQIGNYLSDHPKLARAWELLQTIPGIGPRVAEIVIAEIGINMREVFPTDAQLASWSGLCPGNKGSGGKRLSGKIRHGNTYLRSALVQSALAAIKKKDTFLSAQYRRLVKRLGHKKALVAVAHSLLVIIYHVLDREQSYTELGGDYFDKQQVAKRRAYLLLQLEALGLKVTVEELPDAA